MHSLTITDVWVFLPSFRKEKHQGVVGSSCVLIGHSPRHTLSPIGHVQTPPRLCTQAEMLRLLSSHQSVQFILHEQTGSKVGLSLCKSSWTLGFVLGNAHSWPVACGIRAGWRTQRLDLQVLACTSFQLLLSWIYHTNSFCITTRDHMHF